MSPSRRVISRRCNTQVTGFWTRRRAFLFGIIAIAAAAQEPPLGGDPSCPCLMSADNGLPPIDPLDATDELIQLIGPENANVESSTYGIGCGRHDEFTAQCTMGECSESNIIPAPVGCDQSWCNRAFCWVDPLNCSLLNRRSTFFPKSGRYYSYATCYDMDSFSQKKLLGSLNGRTLRVGFNSNSGGWTGAYARDGKHFEGPPSKWTGPAVNFVTEAALQGGFRINLTEPPPILRNRSVDFFSPSLFDYCVYATALGYLDMCVADYTVTEERAAATDWLLLGTEALYLVVQTDADGQSKWSELMSNVATIFQPFTLDAWLFIILAVIPILGLLMLAHEYNHKETIFPQNQPVTEDQGDGNVRPVKQPQRIPMFQHMVKSVYITLLSTLHQTYEAPAITYGAKVHLLGISFFILTIIAVYTANLAAILTQQALVPTVSSFEDALTLGYRVCGERKNIEDLQNIYGVDSSVFVVDPVEQGGDGHAGFNCANCKSRARVFDFLDVDKADENDSYCHVAIAPLQDLEVFQASGIHCNKTVVGQPVRFVQSGVPVTESLSREAIAFFLTLKNDGVYDKELITSRPESRCPAPQGGEGSALSIEQLMGIWVVTFGFAFLGLLVTSMRPCWLKRTNRSPYEPLHRQNQWGVRVEPRDSQDIRKRLSLQGTMPGGWDPHDEHETSFMTAKNARSVRNCQAITEDVTCDAHMDSNHTETANDDYTSSSTTNELHVDNVA